MTAFKTEIPARIRLHFKKGELIVKEGDFGISIYKVIKGKVEIFNQSEHKDVILAILGPGEFIGEMAFLSKEIQVRSASARAIQDSELEVWHPEILSKDYEDLSAIIKHMTDEAQKRLARMNKFIVQMSVAEEDGKGKTPDDRRKKTASRRTHYRKNVNLACVYRPVEGPSRLKLNGSIKNISITGINMEIRAKNAVNFSHDPGDEFSVKLTLPNGKNVHVTARILAVRKPQTPGTISLGMVFTDMREGAKKTLGFFLMP
jgi:ferredoxin-fold anticodon binding domain-containing protein